MIAILGNSAVFEHDNTIRHAHGGESVRNKKSSFAGRKIGKSLEDCVFAARIQRSSGFVKDEHLRVAEIRAIEEHLPFFRVVKAGHQLNKRGLAFSVFPDKGNTLARAEVKIKVSEDQT